MPTTHQLTKLRFINAYLVEEEDGLTLVDTAIFAKGMILDGARAIGRPIVRIALTHGHQDHIGSLDALKSELPEAEVVFGAREAKLIGQDFTQLPGEAKASKSSAFPKVETTPDRVVEPGDRIGSLEVVAAPGHTYGQIAFLDTRDRTLYCGDALDTLGGKVRVTDRPRRPVPIPALFTTDPDAARSTAEALGGLEPARIAPGHGRVVEAPAEQLAAAIAAL